MQKLIINIWKIMAEVNNKYMKDYGKNKESKILGCK